MPNYRRNYVPGGTYFFTCVTHQRQPFLTSELARKCLHDAIDKVQQDHPFEIVADVLLPDHWHTIWTLPRGDDRYPLRWMRIKELFTKAWLKAGGPEMLQSTSRIKHRLRGVWQKRYWEHTVRDEDDLCRCADYVHWNPRKHGLVTRVQDWPWSSFHRYVEAGDYELQWGRENPVPNWNAPEWGGDI
jgi:putative transposase